MTNSARKITTIALVATLALAAACSKSEPATATTSQPAAATASAPAETVPTASLSGDFPQPTPGSPVATFTPTTDTPAPLLPTLDSTASQPAYDEHSQSPAKADVRRIAPEEAAMLVQSGDAVLLDVRSKEAFANEHIKGATHIPYAEIATRARQELPLTRWIIPYCT